MFRQCLRSAFEKDKRSNTFLEAENGIQALLMAHDNRPALVVLDAQMPRMNGIEATHILRRRHREMRIVVMSAYEEARQQAMDAGADYFLLKNCGFDALQGIIHRLARVPA